MRVINEKVEEAFLSPWSLPQIAQLHTLAQEMLSWGLTPEDIIDICARRLEAERGALPSPPSRVTHTLNCCPECGSPARPLPVNASRCTNIGGPWRSILVCDNPACSFTELSENTLAEWGG